MTKVVIVGNTPSAWIAAAVIKKKLAVEVMVIKGKPDSQNSCNQYDTHRFAEILSPKGLEYVHLLDLDEREVLGQANGLFQLATHYLNSTPSIAGVAQQGFDFMAGYGKVGVDFDGLGFHHFFTKRAKEDPGVGFEAFSLACQMARHDKFVHPVSDNRSILSTLDYGISLEVGSFIEYMAGFAEHKGVTSEWGNVVDFSQAPNGMISALKIDDGTSVKADLFIDATQDGQLIRRLSQNETTHKYPQPYNSIVHGIIDQPFKSGCRESGYSRQLHCVKQGMLQSTPTLNGTDVALYFHTKLMDENSAVSQVKALYPGVKLEHIKVVTLAPHTYPESWIANCVALGASAARPADWIVDEIELALMAVDQLIELFPSTPDMALSCREYNRTMSQLHQRLYEFQQAHFQLITQSDSNFWQAANEIPLTAETQHRILLFKQRGKLASYPNDPIDKAGWINFMLGLGLLPKKYDPILDMQMSSNHSEKMQRMRVIIDKTVQQLPDISQYLAQYLAN